MVVVAVVLTNREFSDLNVPKIQKDVCGGQWLNNQIGKIEVLGQKHMW